MSAAAHPLLAGDLTLLQYLKEVFPNTSDSMFTKLACLSAPFQPST